MPQFNVFVTGPVFWGPGPRSLISEAFWDQTGPRFEPIGVQDQDRTGPDFDALSVASDLSRTQETNIISSLSLREWCIDEEQP